MDFRAVTVKRKAREAERVGRTGITEQMTAKRKSSQVLFFGPGFSVDHNMLERPGVKGRLGVRRSP